MSFVRCHWSVLHCAQGTSVAPRLTRKPSGPLTKDLGQPTFAAEFCNITVARCSRGIRGSMNDQKAPLPMKQLIIFVLFSIAVIVGWNYLQDQIWPRPKK